MSLAKISGDLLLKLSILFGLRREQFARQAGHALIGFNAFEQRTKFRRPFGGNEPELGGIAANGIGQLRAIADKPIAQANQHRAACCSAMLIGTKRIVGRLIASASAISFLPRFTYGLTS
ncbi:hypothetical protein ACVWZM_004111 [Bradyrhizobium sp. USDA 4501]